VIVAHSLADFAVARAELDIAGRRRVVFVATMGALHAGHRALIRMAHAAGDAVVVSIFVNPLQFGPGEDYARYPRPLEDDLAVCESEGVDLVLVPTVADLYPAGRQVTVHGGALGELLEGRFRPGHFDGVLTVVAKLFHIVRPQVALFGQKDAQQLTMVQRMVLDLNMDVEVLGAPTVREADGLALSSRNVFLTAAERALATSLSAALEKAASQDSVAAARIAANEVLDRVQFEPAFELDYATMVNPATFAEVPDDHTGKVLMVLAAKVGSTRLIDNALLDFAAGPRQQERVEPAA
jgi:pantoate--beta-alanine ligase